MSITVVTGLPGAGKSLCLVERMVQMREKEQGRRVFVFGVDGLKDGVAEPLADPTKWEDLPDGSIVVVDEAWKYFGSERPTEKPAHISALAEHRHRGFDFLFATQHPSQLHTFVRNLVDGHIHLKRKFGTNTIQRVEWGELVSDVQSSAKKKLGIESIWRLPKHCFDLYQSATLHTVKRKLPARIWIFPAIVVLVPLLGWIGYRQLHRLSHPEGDMVPAGAVAVAPGAVGASHGPVEPPVTPEAWANRQLPRVNGIPWSAPIFDGQRVTTSPDLLCVIAETSDRQATTCHCYTEQVTRLPQVPEKVCREAAEHGVYNPYRRQASDGNARLASRERSSPPVGFAQRNEPGAGGAQSTPGLASGPVAGVGASVYVPPQYGEWNADPFGEPAAQVQ